MQALGNKRRSSGRLPSTTETNQPIEFEMNNILRVAAVAALLLGGGAAMTASAAVSKTAKKDAERLLSKSDIWLCGQGTGQTEEEAVQAALANIVRQISVTVSSDVTSEASETLAGDKLDSRSDFRSTVRSWSAPMALKGVKTIRLTDSAPYEVVCAIERSDIEDMLDTRRRLVADLCRQAMNAVDERRIDDALKLYYRAYVTLQTLPDREELHRPVGGQSRGFAQWIPSQMRDLCQDVKIGVAEVEKHEDGSQTLKVTATYKGEPVRSMGLSWMEGLGRSGVTTLRDGTGLLELSKSVQTDPLTLEVEFRFIDESHSAGEMQSMIASYNGSSLLGDAPRKTINGGRKEVKADKKEAKAFAAALKATADEGVLHLQQAPTLELAMKDIVRAIAAGDVTLAASRFSPKALEQFQKLLAQGKAKLLGKCEPGTYAFYPMGERMVCRSIPMSFSFDKGRRVFREDVNFTFTPDGKVESLAFGLGSVARDCIFAAGGEGWTDYTKMVLATFLENYRTAFSLKDLEFIEAVFDDNATIIVGGVKPTLEKTKQDDMIGFKSTETVTYTKKTKKQYLADLKKIFGGNDYVNLRFYGTDVEKMGMGGDTFALQMKQDYTSQHYGDEGYLFLLVDFNDPEEPKIKIRTWQPERMPELTPDIPEDSPLHGVFSAGYFGS